MTDRETLVQKVAHTVFENRFSSKHEITVVYCTQYCVTDSDVSEALSVLECQLKDSIDCNQTYDAVKILSIEI